MSTKIQSVGNGKNFGGADTPDNPPPSTGYKALRITNLNQVMES